MDVGRTLHHKAKIILDYARVPYLNPNLQYLKNTLNPIFKGYNKINIKLFVKKNNSNNIRSVGIHIIRTNTKI